MKNIILSVLLILVSGSIARAQDQIITINAQGLFGEYFYDNAPHGNSLTFQASFQYDITTGKGVPNTMLFSFSDNFGLAGFVSQYGVGSSYTNFVNPAGDMIQIGLNEIILDEGPNFPQVGVYPAADMVMLCRSYETCMQPLNAGGYDQADAGSVIVTPSAPITTPEPETWLFIAFDAAVIGLFLWWKR